MGKLKLALLLILLSIVLLYNPAAARDSVWVWYGDSGLAPVDVFAGDTLLIDIFLQTDDSAYVADMMLVLGFDTQYFDTLVSEVTGQIYFPLTEWDYYGFIAQQGSPPNPGGWASQSFMGFARLIPPYDAPLLHVTVPYKVMTMSSITINNPSLAGQTVAGLGPGLNQPSGPSNAGDSVGGEGYQVVEYYCAVHFIGETGYIAGTISDTSGAPSANIFVRDTQQTGRDTSDADGIYVLELPQGTYVVEFSGSGFRDTSVSDIIVAVDETTYVDMVMTIDEGAIDQLPETITIRQNYPNPFNAGTIIEFVLQKPMRVEVEIFDILGRKVETVAALAGSAGPNFVTWYPGNIASGIYFCRVRSANNDESRAMLFIK